jgi:hypothetical protein
MRNTYRILIRKLDTDPSYLNAREIPCYVVQVYFILTSAFFLGGRRGTHTPKHFVNLTGESKNFKMLEFLLNQLQMYYGYLRDLLSFM